MSARATSTLSGLVRTTSVDIIRPLSQAEKPFHFRTIERSFWRPQRFETTRNVRTDGSFSILHLGSCFDNVRLFKASHHISPRQRFHYGSGDVSDSEILGPVCGW